ncbi:hypothetical protein LOZ80_04960 [Paenibacillus sp. HWE-109]|uniref:hypothetical protein n=1 Tax=Paenibacillus sp. HWE-109 TaxID=1306526 RepID=UPI001EDD7481|nr:hypothetical protein [Paenibacillus sp. HWE-109]UKS28289.1 hypothetical protein LOZ80_04960 [Paenibacillus sp. HWE-109]
MWAAYCDELEHGKDTQQPFYCATPEEAKGSHRVFKAALESNRAGQTIPINWRD